MNNPVFITLETGSIIMVSFRKTTSFAVGRMDPIRGNPNIFFAVGVHS
jgi:hypothetical protein